MDIRKLQRAIVDGLEDVKAHDIVVFNTEHLSPLFERVIVASGTSNRQTKALASSVRESVKARGLPVLSVEGADNGEWIIVDCGAAVAHIMQPAIRDYYRLEEIWGGKSVRMKVDGSTRPSTFHAPAGVAKAPSVRKTAAKTPAKTPAKKIAAPPKTAGARTGASARPPAAGKRQGHGAAPHKAAAGAARPVRKTAVRSR
jgi:ribosome-associated protein